MDCGLESDPLSASRVFSLCLPIDRSRDGCFDSLTQPTASPFLGIGTSWARFRSHKLDQIVMSLSSLCGFFREFCAKMSYDYAAY